MLANLLHWLAWLAIPVTLVCAVDDWFLRPKRHAADSPAGAAVDPPLMRGLYAILPVLIIAAVWQMLRSEGLDFSLVLFLIALVSGLIWFIDARWLRPTRRIEVPGRAEPQQLAEPALVDYARSFFPVALVVLVLRSFLFEPFRIPSDSMMPTLLDGDFILVNKYAYGLRLPVVNRKVVELGSPQRGDVVVFRYPPDPRINYIKRVVGLPGDSVTIRDDRLYVNGEPIPFEPAGRYNDGCYENMEIAFETLGAHRHQVLHCRTPGELSVAPMPGCDRKLVRNYVCEDVPSSPDMPDRGDVSNIDVPPGKYLMIGDNRDNSTDGRYFGFVPEENLVGRATRIWFNWDPQRSWMPRWDRIGDRID